MPVAVDVVAPAAEDVVVPTVDDVAALVVAALVVEASDVAADDVVTTDEVVVVAAVVADAAVVAELTALAALLAEEAALLAAALLVVAEDCARAGTGVTVGDVAVPVVLALHAASKVTPLAAANWANSCKQRRRSSCEKAVGRAGIACSLTKRLLTTKTLLQATVPAGGRRRQYDVTECSPFARASVMFRNRTVRSPTRQVVCGIARSGKGGAPAGRHSGQRRSGYHTGNGNRGCAAPARQ
ncbi:MAG TPA: hypothetical protein VGP33_14090 [Chloroflexota bacterium]|nr:hypothetical protein [Chloroflexota bacterium]